MNNPFRILRYLLKMQRPDSIADMRAVKDAFWLRPGYEALTFFGTILTASEQEAHKMNNIGGTLKNHEMIHLRQAQDAGNSWLLFYLRYGWYYLRALPLNLKMKNAAYWLNPFEIEAYRHQNDFMYLTHHKAEEWRHWAKMKPKDRMKVIQKQKQKL